jgi:Major Facilitator Superfamily.
VPSQNDTSSGSRSPWVWIPTLYLAEGLPNAIVTTVALLVYKGMGVSNTEVAAYTGFFYLPWVLKPLWSPVVDLLKTRRGWIWQTQLLMCLALLALVLIFPMSWFVPVSIGCFFLLAFLSATHDIAADGFYILALSEGQQSFFVGIRNTVYRLASLFMKGPFIFLVAAMEAHVGNMQRAWMIAFGGMAALFGLFGLYHYAVLPKPAADRSGDLNSVRQFWAEFGRTFASFFARPKIGILLSFLLLYRFAEALLVPMVQTFLLDPGSQGGLGLSEREFGIVYGTVGVTALMIGGIVGGFVVSRFGLRRCLWPMVLIMNVPDAVFVYLAYTLPGSLTLIGACIAAEQFGYGFGFTAYMLYLIYIARGNHQTAHYAICTGFMALGLMLGSMWSGWLQKQLGYQHFFIAVLVATIPGFIVTALIPLDREFGRKKAV